MHQYLVRPGGLMRCCIVTLEGYMEEATTPPKEGDKLHCEWCRDGEMIFRDGAWEWNRKE